jgi:four helix bundle protein
VTNIQRLSDLTIGHERTRPSKTVAEQNKELRGPHYQVICETPEGRSRPHNREFLRSGTSVAANYRAACRARSTADFISKISVVAEETDETLFWFELLIEAVLVQMKLLEPLLQECEELLKIFSASLATAKRNR